VTRPPTPTRALLLLLAATAVAAQTATPPAATVHKPKPHPTKPLPPPYNPNLIVLDPAHGGQDNGANLGRAGAEKDFTLAFANRLSTLLTAKGFTVVLTHSDASDAITADQRVELANRSRAVACLLLHASAAGHGIHLFTSALTLPSIADAAHPDTYIAPWDSAQATSLSKSLHLVNELATALNGLRVPLIVARASVSPIDSMSCPAVALEIAPAAADSNIADDTYQQHIAESVVTALTYWRQHAQDQIAAQIAAQLAAQNPATPAGTSPAPPAPAAKPKPKPKPVIITAPDEVPLAPDNSTPPAKPAPIERKPPPRSTPPPSGPPQ
jgi:N-acetylmuramoyl-L-alanine amidase